MLVRIYYFGASVVCIHAQLAFSLTYILIGTPQHASINHFSQPFAHLPFRPRLPSEAEVAETRELYKTVKGVQKTMRHEPDIDVSPACQYCSKHDRNIPVWALVASFVRGFVSFDSCVCAMLLCLK